MKHIDFHITVEPNLTVKEPHDIIGKIKKDMNEKINNTTVNVHVDSMNNKEK